ncbi:MAG: DUF3618 domain-containing protein [Acidobacteriota bacterium]
MAEKPGELVAKDSIDPIARTAGAEGDPFMDRYSSEITDSEKLELSDQTSDQPEETEHIKAQIEETRSQLGETIDAIQERLSFANVSEQVSEQVSNAIESAKDSAYKATIGKAVGFMKNLGNEISGTQAFRTVKSNPFPLVLIGLGAGLLAYQSYGRSKRPIRGLGKYKGGSYNTDYTGRSLAGRQSSGSAAGDESIASRTYDNVTDAAGSAYSSVSDAAGSAYSSVAGAAGSAYDSVSGAVGNVASGAGDAMNRAYRSAGELGSKAQEQYEYYIEENPLAVGAVAAALGAAVGFAIPSTRVEGRLMGETRQQLMDKAQNAAGDLIEQTKRVAGEAGKTIKDEARALTQ